MIGKKLKYLVEKSGKKISEVAKDIQENEVQIYRWFKSEDVKSSVLRKFSLYFKVPINYFFEDSMEPATSVSEIKPVHLYERELPYVGVNPQAGFSETFSDLDGYEIEPFRLPNGVRYGDTAFEVAGRSMEDRVKEGDIVVGKKIDKSQWIYIPSNYDNMYIVLFDNTLVLKYIINKIKNQGVVELHSHKVELYPPVIVKVDQLRRIWRVTNVIWNL